MSTVKVTNLQHASSASPNIVLDSSGNATMAGSMAMATPFAMKNKIINGAMEIAQRGTSATPTAGGYFTVDRWRFSQAGSYAASLTPTTSQSSTAPNGFINSLLYTNGTGSAPTSTQNVFFEQYIEGLNCVDLDFGAASAKTITVSFWVRASVTGTYPISLANSATNRTYVATYTINSANTWEQKFITINGDTTGTWLKTNETGVILRFAIGAGSSYQTTAGAWQAGNYFTTSACTNLSATTGATFYLTGVQLEVGSVATPFERRIYSQELAMCQRYFQIFGGTATYEYIGDAVAASTTSAYAGISLLTSMRAVPSVGLTGPVGDFTLDAGNNNLPITSSIVINSGTSTQKARLGITYSSATLNATQYYTLLTYAGSTGKLQFSAEI